MAEGSPALLETLKIIEGSGVHPKVSDVVEQTLGAVPKHMLPDVNQSKGGDDENEDGERCNAQLTHKSAFANHY